MLRACEVRMYKIFRDWNIFNGATEKGKSWQSNRNKTEFLGSFTGQIENSHHHYGFSLEALIQQAGPGFEYRHAVLGLLYVGGWRDTETRMLLKEWILIHYNLNSAKNVGTPTWSLIEWR